jgi:hypothetical protein
MDIRIYNKHPLGTVGTLIGSTCSGPSIIGVEPCINDSTLLSEWGWRGDGWGLELRGKVDIRVEDLRHL